MSHTLTLLELGSQPDEAMLPLQVELGPQSLGFHSVHILPPAPVIVLLYSIVLVYRNLPRLCLSSSRVGVLHTYVAKENMFVLLVCPLSPLEYKLCVYISLCLS